MKKIIAYIRPRLLWHPASPGRDHFLDIAKGWAIVLVVLGHTFQGQAVDFDRLPGFRIIYSFHMPLFVFLSGAAAEHWLIKLSALDGAREVVWASSKRVAKCLKTLLLPFFAWTVIGFYYWKRPESLTAYLRLVFQHPDYSLWYLPCIFWCVCFMLAAVIATKIGFNLIQRMGWHASPELSRSLPLQTLVAFTGWCWLGPRMPTWGGLVFANYFDSGLFAFFVLGIVLFRYLAQTRNLLTRLLPYLVFALLVPYWYRTTPYSLAPNAPAFLRHSQIAQGYAFTVAVAGSLAFIDIIKLARRVNNSWLDSAFRILGTASLAIYALEFYFLGHRPAVIAPILLSLATYQILALLPIVDTVLFGGR